MKEHLTFLHLSDIHFSKGDIFDPDQDLRDELERDLVNMAERMGPVDAILVTGDIAYSGQTSQFDIALEWLKRLCEKLRCKPENVWTCPGNHDIDRQVIENSSTLQEYHATLRKCPVPQLDTEIAKLFRDDVACKSLFLPLDSYNKFGSSFGCEISVEKPTWQRDLLLNDGSSLRLLGLNSTLVSNRFDNDTDAKLVLGTFQSLPPRDDGIEYVTLCHHPPEWLRDQGKVNDELNNRVRIQLFGHTHIHRALQLGNSLRLTAGAVHPERAGADWDPRYNVFTVSVEGNDDDRKMFVRVYPRVWSREELSFKGDYNSQAEDFRDYHLRLSRWRRPANNRGSEVAQAPIESRTADVIVDAIEPLILGDERPGLEMNRARRLTYRYMTLPFHERLRVAQDMGLVMDEDEDVEGSELYLKFFVRAKERNLLRELWEKVERAHGEINTSRNPFADEIE